MDFYNNCKYKNKIKLLGRFDDVFQFFETADIFFYPSYGEGLPNSFLEAISTDISIICYKNTVFPELGKLGFEFEMVDNLNVEDLKKKLLYMVQNLPKKRKNHNSNLAKKIFSPKVMIDKYLAILK
jgi:glycosyltransferase involved in cell wall biosynthesis